MSTTFQDLDPRTRNPPPLQNSPCMTRVPTHVPTSCHLLRFYHLRLHPTWSSTTCGRLLLLFVMLRLIHDGLPSCQRNSKHYMTTERTWDLVERKPDMHIVGCQWGFHIKERVDDWLKCYKMWLVEKGFHQHEGQEFDQTYSVVIKPSMIHTILSLVVARSWILHHIDIVIPSLMAALMKQSTYRNPHISRNPNVPPTSSGFVRRCMG